MSHAAALSSTYSADDASAAATSNQRRRAWSWRQLLTIALAALAIRLLFAAVTCEVFGLTLEQYAHRGDGVSYIRYARFVAEQPTAFTAYDARVFPGYPLLIAPLSLVGIPTWAAAWAINVAAGVLAAVLAAVAFNDVRIGWLMVFLTPVHVACSAMAGNEAPMLAFALAGIVMAGRPGLAAAAVAGVLMGLAGIQRPVACFAVLGVLAVLARRGRWSAALLLGVVATVVVGITMLLVQRWRGDAFYSARFYATSDAAYAGELFAWPGKSLIFTPLYQPVQTLKIPYIWLHAMLIICGTILLAWRMRSGDRAEHSLLALLWLGLNTLYVLMIGNDWGFHALPRFAIPALPPMFYAYRDWLPPFKGRLWMGGWILLAIVSFAVGLYHVRAT